MVEISALDVTARLMKKIDQCLCSFCEDLLEHQPSGSGPFYTLAEVSRADVVRRMKMPAYTAKVFPDGIYPTWPDFLQLKYLENKKLLEHRKKHFIAQGISKKGKSYTFGVVALDPDRPIDPGRIIVFGGIPYKAFEGRFYPMTFAEDSNFHFRGSSSRYRPSIPGILIPVIIPGGGMVFVVSGGGAKQEEYDFTINWRTGSISQRYQILDPKVKRNQ